MSSIVAIIFTPVNATEIIEGVVVSLLFVLTPLIWRIRKDHQKLRAHSEWMARSMRELHMKTDGRPPAEEHPHFDLGSQHD